MKWTPGGRSRNLEDRRGDSPAYGGGGFRMGRAAPLGLGGVAILCILSLLTGTDLTSVFGGGDPGATVPGPSGSGSPVPPGAVASTRKAWSTGSRLP